MKNRRQFIKRSSASVLASVIAPVLAKPLIQTSPNLGTGQKVRVGIIGAENSHTVSFGKIFNQQKKFPGVEVVAVWGETEDFAEKAAQKGSIPKIVKKQEELLELSDAIIIDHRHAKYHAAAAIPFLEAKIPVFIDKPFTYRSQEARQILDLARENKTPITCLSSIGVGPGVEDMKKQIDELDQISSIVITGPADINSKYGGIFFYGIHLVERMFKLFGDDVEAVRATRHGPRTTFQFKFSSEHLATAILAKGWRVYCETGESLQEILPRVETEDTLWMYSEIVKMFQTGQEPRSHKSILRTVTTLEAMERSVSSERWEIPIH